jgi:hypothetical protein
MLIIWNIEMCYRLILLAREPMPYPMLAPIAAVIPHKIAVGMVTINGCQYSQTPI